MTTPTLAGLTPAQEALRALAEKATKGEWACEFVGGNWFVDAKTGENICMLYPPAANAAFIAAANPATILALLDELAAARGAKDAAYLERNQVVAALAHLFPSGIARTAIAGWSDDWHGCVYIDLPSGQVSWHYHNSHAHLFADLPPYAGTWDGHDTPEKYHRVARAHLATPADEAQSCG